MIMIWHNYRSRQFHKTSNGDNPSSGFGDIGSSKCGPHWFDLTSFWPIGKTMALHNYRSRQFNRISKGWNPFSGLRNIGSSKSPTACPPVCLPETARQYPSSRNGWGVKTLTALRFYWMWNFCKYIYECYSWTRKVGLFGNFKLLSNTNCSNAGGKINWSGSTVQYIFPIPFWLLCKYIESSPYQCGWREFCCPWNDLCCGSVRAPDQEQFCPCILGLK